MKSARFVATLIVTLIVSAGGLRCWGDSIASGGPECRLMMRLTAEGDERSEQKARLFPLLREIALGRAETINPDMEKSLGLAPGQFAPSAKDVSVRACALNAIGLLRTAEGNAFLARLGPGDFDSAAVYQLLPVAKTSLLQGKLTQASSQSERRVLLEAALVEVQDPIVLSRFRIWTMHAMCDLGLSASLPAIRSELKEWFTAERAEEELRFCEARIQAVGSSPDRAQALGSVLNSKDATRSNRLIFWAITGLEHMNTDEARRELRRYLTESATRSDAADTQQVALYRKLVEEALERTRVGAPLK